MTPPRDVQDYEAQAREVWASCLHDGDSPSHEPIAAALRAESRAALLAAANRFDRLADTQRPVSIMGIYEVVNLLRDYANELIAPAPESPPAIAPAAVRARERCTSESHGNHCDYAAGHGGRHAAYLFGTSWEDPPAPDPFAGHSDAEVQAALDEVRGKAPAPSGEPQPPHWRIGRHYGIHVYCGDTPIATFHTVADAKAAVRAYNANLDRQGAATGEEG